MSATSQVGARADGQPESTVPDLWANQSGQRACGLKLHLRATTRIVTDERALANAQAGTWVGMKEARGLAQQAPHRQCRRRGAGVTSASASIWTPPDQGAPQLAGSGS